MILTDAIARLRGLANSPFAAVQGAEELEALSKGTPPKHGTVFLVPHQERGESNSRMSGGVLQRVEVRFLAAVVIRQAGDTTGAKRIEASDQFAAALERAFAGWCWHPKATPAEFDGARAQALGNGVTLYAQTWRTDRWIEA